MTTLQELIKQKQDIERQIKELRASSYRCNKAKADKETVGRRRIGYQQSERWYVAVENGSSWRKIIYGETEEEIAAKLTSLINDLIQLAEKFKGVPND